MTALLVVLLGLAVGGYGPDARDRRARRRFEAWLVPRAKVHFVLPSLCEPAQDIRDRCDAGAQ